MSRGTRADMRKLIEKLSRLDADRWHQITMKMAWVYRTDGGHAVPAVILAGFAGKAPDKAAWATLRARVNARRKAARAEERRHIERERIANRRKYMRKYMKEYRERQARAD